MQYMENHFDKRLDPRLLVPGAKSVISLLYNYYPKEATSGDNQLKVSKYAWGDDYHLVVRDKLHELFNRLREAVGDIQGRVFVDSAPVMERSWAAKSGLGWVGKHSLLLNRSMGSFFFLAEIICDLEFEYDGPMGDYCGSCTACMDACPTDAITQPYVVDGSRCISYLTIELKEEIPEEFSGKLDNWMFGCDICQDVCPWNRFAQPHQQPRFDLRKELNMNVKEWEALSEETFNALFRNSPLKRPGYKGIRRTIAFLTGKKPE